MRIPLFGLLLLPGLLHAQVIDLTWPNQPCATVLNCDTGCTACNLPAAQGAALLVNAPAFLGVDVCPHPVTVGDNAVLTYGWPAEPDTAHAVLITGLAFTPTRIDSVVLHHRRGADGPARLQVRYGINATMPTTVIADVPVADSFQPTALADLGTAEALEDLVGRLHAHLSRPLRIEACSLQVGASIGVALAQPDDTLASLLERADQAMYDAKQAGRAGVRGLALH